PNSLQGAVDGSLLASGAITNPSNLGTLSIGKDNPGGTNYLNGYVQRVGIYGDLSDAALSYSTIGPISWANFDARPAPDSTPIL
ncbi:hypothetical protein V2W23_14590, partial [Staphylococcus gallinarum]|uniref:hypothetical protein n=1 Tax=Staphylococcus gallinarum TaxID=1293 RepID=UPI003173F7F9